MVSKTIDLITLKGLLSHVTEETENILTESNHQAARLVPIIQRVPGLHGGDMKASEDFDEPLSEEYFVGTV